jgi:3-oxoacyl-ACP reductase-like protein
VELSSRQRSAVFAVIVIALAALGYYLIVPATHTGGHAAATLSPTPASQSAATATAQAPAAAPVTPSAAAAGGVNIYAWLPFTQQDLADAALVAVRFSIDYNTYTYTENAAAYVARMTGLITGELAATLQAGYSTPGVASTRTSQQQVSTGTAAINSLRAFGPSSLTFMVNTAQHLVSSHGTSNGSTQYAVTLTGSGSSWQVSDIELSSAGNS